MQLSPQNISVLNSIKTSFERSMISTMYMVSDFSKSGVINPDESTIGGSSSRNGWEFIICGETRCGRQSSHGEEKCR